MMSTDPTPTDNDAAGRYLVKDLDGCRVLTEEGDELGVLKDVYATGADDVFSVRNDKREYLVPARKDIVLAIDLVARVITVRLPAGLREIYES